jgi:hypothetical protein
MEAEAAQPKGGVTKGGRKWLFLVLLLAAIAAATAVSAYSRKHALNDQVQAALAGETGAETVVYRRALFGGDEIVFDITSVGGEISMVDMTRRLLKSAEALQKEDFDRVYLAYKGQEKFYFDGAYFKQIGAERDWQNPVFTIRTMPENVRNLDGTQAFESWSGGLIGVIGAQMEDNAKFHRQWWTNEATADLG